MKHLLIQSASELPVAKLPVCPRCNGFLQSPNPKCTERHGTANPREVLRQLCKVAGHVLVAGGKARPCCTRCGRPRSAVVV